MTDWKVARSRCMGWVGLLVVEILLLGWLSTSRATNPLQPAAVPDGTVCSGDTLVFAHWRDASVEPHVLRDWFNHKFDPFAVPEVVDADSTTPSRERVVFDQPCDPCGYCRGLACLPQDTLVRHSAEGPLLFQLLFDDLLSIRVKSRVSTFQTKDGRARRLPSLDIHGEYRLAKVHFPSPEEERRDAEWVETWELLGKYPFLFWCTRAQEPGRPRGMSEHEALERMIQGHLPKSSVTDEQLKHLWGPDALWREQNLPYVTIYVGATEYRVRTYQEDEGEGRATTYHVQIHVRPREVPS